MKNGVAGKLQYVLGFQPEKLETLPGGALRTLVSLDRFQQIVQHWRGLGPEALPRLRAITPAASESSRLLLDYVLELPEENTLLNLELDVSRDRTLPDLKEIWPHCEWWQEELAVFAGARIEGLRPKEESPWQQA